MWTQTKMEYVIIIRRMAVVVVDVVADVADGDKNLLDKDIVN